MFNNLKLRFRLWRTRKERLEFYKTLLNWFKGIDEPTVNHHLACDYGLCTAIRTYNDKHFTSYKKYYHLTKDSLPELVKQKPDTDCVWWWWQSGDRQPRIKALEEAIKLLEK